MEKEKAFIGLIKREISSFTNWFFSWPFQVFSRLSASMQFCTLLTLAVNVLFKLFNAALTFQIKVNTVSLAFLFLISIVEGRERNGS